MIKFYIILILFIFNLNSLAQNGNVKTYYSSGKIQSKISFVNDVLEGSSFWYYENGNIKIEKNFSNGKINGLVKNYYESGLLKDEAHFLNGILHGVYRSYHDNGALGGVKAYDLGKLNSSTEVSYDSTYIAPLSAYNAGKRKNNLENNDFLCGIDICPEPVGGIEEIESNIVYPSLAKQYNLEGKVLISATITKKGEPKNIQVIKGIGLGCDEAAIEAVKNTLFVPGRNNDEEIESDVTFNLNFSLDKEDIVTASFDSANTDTLVNAEDQTGEPIGFIACDVDKCPEPEGGIIELINKLRYPPQAIRNNIQGNVKIKAKVNEFGFVISTEVLTGLGFGCDQAAKSVVIKTQFTPGQISGVDSESVIEIIVPFIINEKSPD